MPIPDWLEPMAATLTQERFSGGEWLFDATGKPQRHRGTEKSF